LSFATTSLIVACARLPGHESTGAYCANALITQRWIGCSIGAENCSLWRWDVDFEINPKEFYKQVAGGAPS
jgi:hypothetical protein